MPEQVLWSPSPRLDAMMMVGRAERPVLILLGGLPGTGKSTIARLVAAELGASYVRVDTIEAAIDRAAGDHAETNQWVAPPGYVVGLAVAVDQLRGGLQVVVESVNPTHDSRDAWRDAGRSVGARVVEVEVVCSDADEHRRRVERRVSDVDGLVVPTWRQVVHRVYEPWSRPRLVVDTRFLSPEESAAAVVDQAVGHRGG